MFGEPGVTTPIIEPGILYESAIACQLRLDTQVHTSWMML